jgi:hypothetical protein
MAAVNATYTNQLSYTGPVGNAGLQGTAGQAGGTNYYTTLQYSNSNNYYSVSYDPWGDLERFLSQYEHPDFEKSYDIFIESNPDASPKDLFLAAMKISYAIAKLKTNDKKEIDYSSITGYYYNNIAIITGSSITFTTGTNFSTGLSITLSGMTLPTYTTQFIYSQYNITGILSYGT